MIRTTRYAGSFMPSGMKRFNMRIGGTKNDFFNSLYLSIRLCNFNVL